MQIPKEQKRLTTSLSFFVLLGSVRVKAAHRMLVKLTPGADAVKKLTPSLGIPYLGVYIPR